MSDVVVVLPCVPATAIPYFMRINSANISALGMTGIWRSRAIDTSALSGLTADDVTTTSAPMTWAASCPWKIVAPPACNRRVISEAAKSDPLTA